MEFINKYKYAIISPSSMGIRLTPTNRQPVHISDTFMMRASSAETNVLSISSALGLSTKVLTAFVSESPIAQLIKQDLLRRNIQFEGKEVKQNGPWGYRHQFNIADSGYGIRAPRVHNDRAGEVGRLLSSKDFNLERIFGEEGVQVLHLSGIVLALSDDTFALCLELVKTAKKYGTKVSFDLNYRSSFWKNREDELREKFREIASLSDILIGNEEDYQLALGICGPAVGGKQLSHVIESFKTMIYNVKEEFPNVELFASTLREVKNANQHQWGAILLNGDEWTVIEPREIQVLDRIGGGDGFVGGLLYGFLKGWSSEKCCQFAWATGALATTVIEDYALPADEAQVWSIWEENARVQR
ncbi:MAG: sugar kinase [Bacillota bacterium]|nr:MAG: sugar kinase [Bacillota bacterium]